MTSAYFSTLFKYYTGHNFKDYLNSYRVKVSKELLQSSNLKINEVAEKVGCNNVKHLFVYLKSMKVYHPVSILLRIREKILFLFKKNRYKSKLLNIYIAYTNNLEYK
jgi:YesN/AraC family two-component response regulator